MGKSKFWLLFRIQFKEALTGRSRRRKHDAGAGTERKRSSGTGYTVLATIAMIIVVGVIAGICVAIAIAMHEIGQDQLTILIATVAGSAFSLFTTIYETNGLLFGYRDYDMTMAMPVRTSELVAIRLSLLYLDNLAYCAVVMLPAGITYAVLAGVPWTFWPLYIIGILLTPLLPTIIATAIGIVIAVIASRFERKGIMNIIFTLVFLVAYMMFIWNMDNVIESFAEFGPLIADVMGRIWPPGVWLEEGCCSGNAGAYWLFAGLSIGLFAVYCYIVGRYFIDLNSMLSASREKRSFRMTSLETSSPRKALLKSEISRLFTVEGYFMNCCIGYIICIVFAIIVVIVGPATVLSNMTDEMALDGMDTHEIESTMAIVATGFISMFMAIGSTTALSISLEGRNLWIIQTAPVSVQVILRAKRQLTLIMGLPAVLTMGVCGIIAFPDLMEMWALFFLEPFAFLLFGTMFGQQLNLKYPVLEWTSAMSVIKRSTSVMIMSFTCMGIGFANLMLSLMFGIWVNVAVCGGLYLWSLLIYRRLCTWGVDQFRQLSYQ